MVAPQDFDDFSLTASELVTLTQWRNDVKMVHNLTDRGIIPFRKNGRSRMYSFGSVLAFDTIMRLRTAGVALHESGRIAEVVIDRAKERIADLYVRLSDIMSWAYLAYAFDPGTNPPYLAHYIVSRDEPVKDLEMGLLSGWNAEVTSLFPVDRVIWECADSFDRLKAKKEKDQ